MKGDDELRRVAVQFLHWRCDAASDPDFPKHFAPGFTYSMNVGGLFDEEAVELIQHSSPWHGLVVESEAVVDDTATFVVSITDECTLLRHRVAFRIVARARQIMFVYETAEILDGKPEEPFQRDEALPSWRVEGGAWVRDWEIVLAKPISLGAFELSENGIEARATLLADRRTLRIVTRTKLDAPSDEVFFGAAYRMLRRIDGEIGRIELIQGQPSAWWQPFRTQAPG